MNISGFSTKHSERLEKIIQSYVKISGNNVSIANGQFVVVKHNRTIRRHIEASQYNLKKEYIPNTTMKLRAVFFNMLKQIA